MHGRAAGKYKLPRSWTDPSYSLNPGSVMKRSLLALAIVLIFTVAGFVGGASGETEGLRGRSKVNFFPFIDCQDAKLRKAAGLDAKRLNGMAGDLLAGAQLEVVEKPDADGIMLSANLTAERTDDGYSGSLFIRAFVVQKNAKGKFESTVIWSTPGVDVTGATPRQLSAALDKALAAAVRDFIDEWDASQDQ